MPTWSNFGAQAIVIINLVPSLYCFQQNLSNLGLFGRMKNIASLAGVGSSCTCVTLKTCNNNIKADVGSLPNILTMAQAVKLEQKEL